MTHPYRAFEGTWEWHAIDAALRDLERNSDVELTTARPYVIGYLVRALALAPRRGGEKPAAAAGQAAQNRPSASERSGWFTGDDYQLIADASYREEDRRELFAQLHGIPAPPDDQLDRLADLARRLNAYLREQDTEAGGSPAAT